jgi:uncharacterized protein YdiU (UPF0061 family)
VTFYETLTAAINDFMRYGFDSQSRLEYWVKMIRQAAIKALIPESQVQKEVEKALKTKYSQMVTHGGLVNKNVSRFTVDKLTPKMRAELDRRIMASVNLINYNREEAINNTLRRFSGWATSIPKGGTKAVDKVQEKKDLRKDLAKMPFKERRVIIDQTTKLINNINEIVAIDSGAIAARWHSNWKQTGYDYREDHRELDRHIYVIKGSKDQKAGLLRAPNGYTDEIVAPGELPYCRCRYHYIFKLKDLPEEFLTVKGKKAVESQKSK